MVVKIITESEEKHQEKMTPNSYKMPLGSAAEQLVINTINTVQYDLIYVPTDSSSYKYSTVRPDIRTD